MEESLDIRLEKVDNINKQELHQTFQNRFLVYIMYEKNSSH